MLSKKREKVGCPRFAMFLKNKLLPLVSLILFSALILGYLWWGKFQYHHGYLLFVAYVGGVVVVVVNHLYHRDTFKRLGLRYDNFWRAARWYGGLTLALGAIISALGLWKGNVRLDRWSDVYTYFPWAIIQQYVLQNFLRLRSENLLGSAMAPSSAGRGSMGPVLLAVTLFAVYHLPNYPLIALTFIGGLFWCFLFVRIPNLFWVCLSQAFLTTIFLLFFKYGFVNQFQVGSPGYRYEFYGSGVKVAAGYDADNNPVIATLPGSDKGTKALVRIFTMEGRKLAQWEAFQELDFSGEISVGDLGFGPGDELAVTPGPGPYNPPLVRVFDFKGNLLEEFQPDNLDHGYGAWISIHCGKLYICPGPGPASPQQVFEFSPRGLLLRNWEFDNLGLVNGLRTAALCWDNSPGENLSFPHRQQRHGLLLWASDISVNPSTVFLYDTAQDSSRSFETLTTSFGVNSTLIRLVGNRLGVGVAPGPLQGYPPLIQVFDLNGEKLNDFFAFNDPKSCGSNIAAVDIDGDGEDELVLGEGIGPGRPPLVRIYRLNGQLVARWKAYEES